MKPFFEKREQPHGAVVNVALILGSIFLALVLSAGMVAAAGKNPGEVYQAICKGVFGRTAGMVEMVVKGTPLLLAGLGMVFAFKAKVWNVGGEGQIYMGALAATWVGVNLTGLPAWLHLPLALLAGAIAGSLWALIPALLKVYMKVNEVITSLMLNYIAILFISWVVHGPMQEVGGFMPQTPRVANTAILPLLFPPSRLHAGVILAITLAFVVYLLLFYTPLGYNIRAVGANPSAAEHGGIRVSRTILLVMVMSGMMTGLAGANEVLGFHYRLMDGISPGYGFTAMVVALLGKLNPLAVVLSAYLFASLNVGAAQMQRVLQVPIALSQVIQGLVVLCVLGTELLLEYDFVPLRKLRKKRDDALHPAMANSGSDSNTVKDG